MAEEGYDVAHDDHHLDGELLHAALAYLCVPGLSLWPFEPESFKPSTDPIRNMVKAGALLAAEGDRLIRRQQSGLSVTGGLIVLGVDPEENMRVVEGLQQVSTDLKPHKAARCPVCGNPPWRACDCKGKHY